MQQLYLDDQGTARTNVASDVATSAPNVEIATAEGISPKSLNIEKGEIIVEAEVTPNTVPNTPDDEEDDVSTKIVEEALNSLANAVPGANVVSDTPTSLAQTQPLSDAVGTVEGETDNVMADQDVNLEKDANVAEDTDKVVSSEEDLVVLKSVYGKRSEKAGVGSRLRERKGKETVVAAEATKSSKKKKVATEATKSSKKQMI
jgi:hypothetical protein